MENAIRLNEAEWLIEPFYEVQARQNGWAYQAPPGVTGKMANQWQSLALTWHVTAPGGRVARITRSFDLDVSAADRLCLRASFAEDQRLTLRAVVDGAEKTVLDAVAGRNVFAEFEGELPGRHLQGMEIEVVSTSGDPGQINLLWLLAIDTTARSRYRNRATVYDAAWPELMRDDEPPLVPVLGLWFGVDAIPALRAKVSAPPYAAAWRQLRRQAGEYGESQPERGVREHLWRPNAGSPERYGHDLMGEAESEHEIRPEPMQTGALVGLLDDDHAMARIAIRHALAAMHCTHWDDSFMMTRPGARWDHRAFTAWNWLTPFLAAIDWAGALLTPTGLDLAARTISTKVLPMLDYSLRKYSYMRGNNQGIFFASAGVQAICALDRLVEHGRDGLDWYLDVLRESTENYILPDGGSYEGAAYFDGSCTRALDGFAMAARTLEVPVDDLLPPCLLRAHRYYRAMASTAFPGACVAISDGGRVGRRVAQGAVPRLAALTGDTNLRHITAALLKPQPDGDIPGALPLVLHGPADLPEPDSVTPTFEILPDTGILCSCRPTPNGPVRLQFVGGKANAGHTHEDKGSFILEAFGEELLIDRGTCFYGDARSGLMKHAVRHNLATPDDNGKPGRQQNPVPKAVIPTGRGDQTTLETFVDTTPAWSHLAASCSRCIESETPTHLVVTDRIERLSTGAVSVHFQSRCRWQQSDGCWLVEDDNACVKIHPDWEVGSWDAREDIFDSRFEPVYRLTLRTTPAKVFELRTHLTISLMRTEENS